MLHILTSSPTYQSWRRFIACYLLVAAFGWSLLFLVAALFLYRVRVFWRRVDRSSIQFPDPFPEAQHDYVVTASGLRLHVVTSSRNTGTRPLVLFLHGFPECWYSWRHQLAVFQGSHDVAAIDMRGYNLSDKPQDVRDYQLPELAADIPAVVKALGRDKCILVGHDWGAAVAWSVASLHPEVVDRVACLTVPPPALLVKNMRGKQLLRSCYVFAFQLPLLPELLLSMDDFVALAESFSFPDRGGPIRKGAVTPADVEYYKAALGHKGALTAALNYYRANFRMVLYDDHKPAVRKLMQNRISVPAMMVYAEKDLALGRGVLEGLQDMVPGARLHCVRNCSHFMQQDQPEQVTQLLKDFFEEELAAPTPSLGGIVAGTLS